MPCGGRRYDPLIVSTPLVTGWHLDDSLYPLFGRTNVTARKAFLNELRDMVTTLYNHPCIAVWVPFNEGWGQFDSQTAVQVIQSVDKTRTIDPASGWHDQGFGDVRAACTCISKYRFQPDKLGRATLLSEFGGYIHRVEAMPSAAKSVGYKTCDARSRSVCAQALYDEQIRPAIAQGLSAAVYRTAGRRRGHELNGLVTYDRSIVAPVQRCQDAFISECKPPAAIAAFGYFCLGACFGTHAPVDHALGGLAAHGADIVDVLLLERDAAAGHTGLVPSSPSS